VWQVICVPAELGRSLMVNEPRAQECLPQILPTRSCSCVFTRHEIKKAARKKHELSTACLWEYSDSETSSRACTPESAHRRLPSARQRSDSQPLFSTLHSHFVTLNGRGPACWKIALVKSASCQLDGTRPTRKYAPSKTRSRVLESWPDCLGRITPIAAEETPRSFGLGGTLCQRQIVSTEGVRKQKTAGVPTQVSQRRGSPQLAVP